jgi:hypothetical protein
MPFLFRIIRLMGEGWEHIVAIEKGLCEEPLGGTGMFFYNPGILIFLA